MNDTFDSPDFKGKSTRKLTKGERYWYHRESDIMHPHSMSPYQPIPGFILVKATGPTTVVIDKDPLPVAPTDIDGARPHRGGAALTIDYRRHPEEQKKVPVSNPDALSDHEVLAKAAQKAPSAR